MNIEHAQRELLTAMRAQFPNVTRELREDAAQNAWCIYMRHRERLREDAMGWLIVVARREVLRLLGKNRTASLEVLAESGWEPADPTDPDAREEAIDAMALIGQLRPLRRRALIGRAIGLSYQELGARTGTSYTNVNRHVTEGRAELRALAAR